jgi:hypothetical protein
MWMLMDPRHCLKYLDFWALSVHSPWIADATGGGVSNHSHFSTCI